jgi:hypothetical protein
MTTSTINTQSQEKKQRIINNLNTKAFLIISIIIIAIISVLILSKDHNFFEKYIMEKQCSFLSIPPDFLKAACDDGTLYDVKPIEVPEETNNQNLP